MPGFGRFFYNQFFASFAAPTSPSLAGRTVVITGANTGLGFEAAHHLAALKPAVLILACRSIEKGQRAAEVIVAKTGFTGTIDVWALDLASFASVSAFAKRLDTLPRLDILLENAGINAASFQLSADGHEMSSQVNVLSTGLLGVLSLPILKRTASKPLQGPAFKPRLTIVASETHEWAAFKEAKSPEILKAFNDPQNFSSDRYPTSKLLDIFLTNEIANLAGDDVQVVCVNPGFCKSELTRDFDLIIVRIATAILGWTTEKGSRNLAAASVYDFPSASYISTCVPTRPGANATNAAALDQQKRLWAEASQVWQAVDPTVETILKSKF